MRAVRAHPDGCDSGISGRIQRWRRILPAAVTLNATCRTQLDLAVDVQLWRANSPLLVDDVAVTGEAPRRLGMRSGRWQAVAAAASSLAGAGLRPNCPSVAVAVSIVAAASNGIVARDVVVATGKRAER